MPLSGSHQFLPIRLAPGIFPARHQRAIIDRLMPVALWTSIVVSMRSMLVDVVRCGCPPYRFGNTSVTMASSDPASPVRRAILPAPWLEVTPVELQGAAGRPARFALVLGGKSLRDAAKMLGTSHVALSAWIRGKPRTKLAKRQKMAELLGAPLEWLEQGTGVIPEVLRQQVEPLAHAQFYCRLVGFALTGSRSGAGRLPWRLCYGVPSVSVPASEWISLGKKFSMPPPPDFTKSYSLLVERYSAPQPVLLTREEIIAIGLRQVDRYGPCDAMGEPLPDTIVLSGSYHTGMHADFMKKWPDLIARSHWGQPEEKKAASVLLDAKMKLAAMEQGRLDSGDQAQYRALEAKWQKRLDAFR